MADVWLNIKARNIDEIESKLTRIEEILSRLEKSHDLNFNTSGISSATRQLSQMERSAQRVERVFSGISRGMSVVGGSMQSLGNLFGGRVVNTAKTMATAFGTMGLYSAAQGTIERYDIMRMFPKNMEHLGYKSEESKKAIKDLEDAVIGLPTGLDEIVESARQLIPLAGDMNEGVKLAIAANNAFLAGGADAQATRFGQRQIKDLLSKGTLRSQEWDSLFSSLGSGLGVIAEEMGYSSKASKGLSKVNDDLAYAQSRLKSLRNTQKRYEKEGGTDKQIQKNADAIKTWEAELEKLEAKQDKSLGSFRSALKSNKIDALDFLEALKKVGTEGGELAKRADDYKDTISAAARNIKNALQKLGAAGLDSLDNVLTQRTGKGIPGTIREISDSIKQNLVPALEGWVSDNGDKIVGFFDKLKNYDWIDLVSRVGKGLAQYYDIMTGFFTKVSPKVVAFLSVWAGPIGRLLQTASAGVEGVGRLIGFLIRHVGTAKAAKAVGDVADTVSGVSKIGRGLTNAFKGLGLAAGITGEVALLGGVIAEYAKIIEMISNLKIGPNWDQNINKVENVMAATTVVAGSLTTLFSVISGFGFGGVAAAGEGLAAGFIGIVGELGHVIGIYVKAINDIGTMTIPDDKRMEKLGHALRILNDDVLDDIPIVSQKKVNSMDNLSEIVEYAKGIAESLKSIKQIGNFGDMSKKTSAIVKAATETYKALPEKKVPQKYADSAENLGSIMESTLGIATSMVNMKKKLTYLSTKGKSGNVRYEMIADQLKAILGKDGMGGILSQFAADKTFDADSWGVIAENLGKYEKGTTTIGKIVTTLMTAKESIKKLTTFSDRRHAWKSVTAKRLKGLLSETLAVFEDKKLFARTQENEIGMQNLERFSNMTKSVGTIAESLFKAQKNISAITEKSHRGRGSWRMNAEMFDQLTAIVKGIKGWADEIEHIPGFEDLDTSGELPEKLKTLGDMAGKIPELVKNLKGIDLKGIGFKKGEFTLGDNLGKVVNGLGAAFSSLAEADYTDMGDNAESLRVAVSKLTGKEGIITALKGVQDKIGNLGVVEGVWPAGESLKVALQTLMGIFPQNFGQTMAGGDLLGGVASNLQAIVGTLEQLAANAQAAASNLKAAAKGVDKLGQSAAEQTGAIEGVADAAKELKSGVSGIGGRAMLAATGVTILGNSAKNQVDNMSAAAGAAAALAAAINAIPTSKTISINTTGNAAGAVTQSGYAPGTTADFHFYSSGGSVHGPGGIDNVKARLTNGEFVMRRSAHSKFGTAFMNRINNLDVDGAMRALSLRAGSGIFRRANVTNNYSRDNHANVTFNVGRASQGFAQRRASRWARSLS